MIQICTALITILVLKALKAMPKYGWNLSNLVAFIRLNLFVKIDLQHWLNNPFNETDVGKNHSENLYQGVLFLIN
jgi:hypothetical protein